MAHLCIHLHLLVEPPGWTSDRCWLPRDRESRLRGVRLRAPLLSLVKCAAATSGRIPHAFRLPLPWHDPYARIYVVTACPSFEGRRAKSAKLDRHSLRKQRSRGWASDAACPERAMHARLGRHSTDAGRLSHHRPSRTPGDRGAGTRLELRAADPQQGAMRDAYFADLGLPSGG